METLEREKLFSNRDILVLVVPLLLEVIFNAAIGSFDTLMVSSCGEAAVSGVSLVDSICTIFLFVIQAFATSGAVVASQYMGRGEKDMASRSAKQLLLLSFSVIAVISALLITFRRAIMGFVFGSVEDIVLEASFSYIIPISLSLPFLALINSSNALCRSMRRTKVTLMVSILMNLLNIAGNAVFIYALKMGPLGAGLASLISRAVAAIVMFIVLVDKKKEIHLIKPFRIEVDFRTMKRIIRIAVPAGIENAIFHVGRLLIASTISVLGTASIAAYAVTGTLGAFMHMPGTAVGMASVTIIGQCVGKGDYKAARYYGRKLMIWANAGVFLLTLPMLLFIRPLVGLYNLSPLAADLTVRGLVLHGIQTTLFWSISFVLPDYFRASGDVVFPMEISLFSMWMFRVIFSYILGIKMGFGLIGVFWGMYLDWYFRIIIFVIRWKGHRWEKKNVI